MDHATGPSDVKLGTRVTVGWPGSACSALTAATDRILQTAAAYAALNPHLTLAVDWFGATAGHAATAPDWRRWHGGRGTSPHWYTAERFVNLLGKLAAADRDGGRDRTVRELVETFDGFKGSAKQKAASAAADLTGARLSALVGPAGIDHAAAARLLAALKAGAKEVPPATLGVLPKDHLTAALVALEYDPDTAKVAKACGTVNGRPYVLQVAFGADLENDPYRRLMVGINNSPAVNPLTTFTGLDGVLSNQEADDFQPVAVVAHLAMPGVAFADRGKARAELPAAVTADLNALVAKVTKPWAKQVKAEQRDADAAERRRDALTRSRRAARPSITSAVFEVLADAYAKAAGNVGMATQRNVYYVVRVPVLEATGRAVLNYGTFTALLSRYLRENPETTAEWLVAYDDRGELIEPHTGKRVGLGTIHLMEHRRQWTGAGVPAVASAPPLKSLLPTVGPQLRYGAMLFCEKAGLLHVLQHSGIDRRYDLALMSTKGMPTVAGRDLVAAATATGVPTLTIRDFDKSGFSIARTLSRSNARYTFGERPDVRHLGLRLDDARAWGLESEPAVLKGGDPRPNLIKNGATAEEADYIAGRRMVATGKNGRQVQSYHGRRVELNAFTSDALVRWLEEKLAGQGIAKVVPDAGVLADAYRRAAATHLLNDARPKAVKRAVRKADALAVPPDLEARVRRHLEANPTTPWDAAVSAEARAAM